MYKLYFLLLCVILPNLTFAQKNKKVNYIFSQAENISIDASLNDWEGQLTNVPGDLWSFAVTEQKNELFVAILIKDLQLQREAFRGGLFVDISYTDKKKEGARLQFPYWDRERRRALANDDELASKNFEEELLNNVNGYFLTGFGRVRDGVLAVENDYNIEAKVKIDSNKCLVYEARIPLNLVGLKSKDIAVNLGVNTQYGLLKRAASNSNRNRNISPMMMGRPTLHSSIKNPYTGETDVWVFDKIKN
jgi:hypothetical protein